MEQTVHGKAFVLGDNTDTDQIIPAEYLSYNPADPDDRKYFGKYALTGVPTEISGLPNGGTAFVEEGQFKSMFAVIIAGKNFGCGSSREHAPLAISEANCHVVIAESYARIFYRNSINGGYLVPLETDQRLIDRIATGDEVELDLQALELVHLSGQQTYKLQPLGDTADIVRAGGVFPYAKSKGMLS